LSQTSIIKNTYISKRGGSILFSQKTKPAIELTLFSSLLGVAAYLLCSTSLSLQSSHSIIFIFLVISLLTLSLYELFFQGNKNTRITKQIIFTLLLINVLVILVPYIKEMLPLFNAVAIKDILERYNSATKLIYFLICFLQPILLPLPEAVTVSVGSAMFGSLTSILLSFTGTILGIVVMYFIAKVGGQKLVLKLVKERHLKGYQEYVGKNETTILALLFIIPVLPDEIICVGAGISGVSFKRFLIIASISKLITSSVLSYSVYFTKSLSLTSSEIVMLCSGVIGVVLIATVILKKVLRRKNVQKAS